MSTADPRIIELAKSLGKRPRSVVEHIIKHGSVSTTELKDIYGYNHAPRAARDVREAGIPLVTKMVKNQTTGRKNAEYTFGDLDKLRNDILKGRKNFPPKFKKELFKLHEYKCEVCNAEYSPRVLQIDHRIPFEVAGDEVDTFANNIEDYMPLCPSDNRNKSFSCESCKNWLEIHNSEICKSCYWASPKNYEHISMIKEKRAELIFRDKEIKVYEALTEKAQFVGESVEEYILNLIKTNK
ncbi:HNH endonuclease signature motif containing protein [Bacillus subtilis]|uniref:HNH endonuclease signature motif containing protein n=1 Tax=Bacillus subtilis TaxID=1423 RepID=UPI002DBD20E1|nr:HNH endonuclease signature motif containing protein [Bacillus subtilis]MEC1581717.1 HNH endonuclease signature motif containing protein [Bacillus subtilis]